MTPPDDVGNPSPSPVPVVVLVSGSGTLLQALADRAADPSYGVRVAAVGADRDDIEGLARAERAGIPTFVCRAEDFSSREHWDEALAGRIEGFRPRFVVSAGFMKILGPRVRGSRLVLNCHPALLPSFPGPHAVRDALAYGVRVTGATVHVVDAGVDSGPIIAQAVVDVREDDDLPTLHERIKVVERRMLVDVVGRLARDGWSIDGRKVRIP